MEGTTQSSRVKEYDLIQRKDSKKKKDDETFVYCSRKKQEGQKSRSFANCQKCSMLSIVTSLNNNCCLCCGAFARYIRAVVSCLSCCIMCRVPQTDFERLFCELVEATGDTCFDLMCAIKKFLHVCLACCKK